MIGPNRGNSAGGRCPAYGVPYTFGYAVLPERATRCRATGVSTRLPLATSSIALSRATLAARGAPPVQTAKDTPGASR